MFLLWMNGEELLDHRRVGALATRKAARDFNQQVYNDLFFLDDHTCEGPRFDGYKHGRNIDANFDKLSKLPA